MRSCRMIFLLISLYSHAYSQNLVPNSGFDEIVRCPYDINQIHFAEPWYNPSNGYAMLYNACSTEERFAVPRAGISVLSYMEPRSGDGYAYLRIYRNTVIGIVTYIATPLIKPLEKNRNYYI